MLEVATPPARMAIVSPSGVICGAAVLRDLNVPALLRRFARDRDVATQADQDASAVHRLERRRRGEIGGERFRGRAQVDLDTGVDLDTPRGGEKADPPPPGHREHSQRERVAVSGNRAEIDAVAGVANRCTDRRIDRATGDFGGAQCGGKGLGKQRRHDAFSRPSPAPRRLSSLSSRKRLHA